MRSRKRRRYRKNKWLERYFRWWSNEFGFWAPHTYQAIERWLPTYPGK